MKLIYNLVQLTDAIRWGPIKVRVFISKWLACFRYFTGLIPASFCLIRRYYNNRYTFLFSFVELRI